MKRINLTILIAICLLGGMYAQSLDRYVIGAAGTYAENASHQLSYTVGELAVTTVEQGTLILHQGFHQTNPPYNLAFDPDWEDLDILVYPNPTSGWIKLEMISSKQMHLKLLVYNALGQLSNIPARELSFVGKQEIKLDLHSLAEGQYYLLIQDQEGRFVRTLRVEKF